MNTLIGNFVLENLINFSFNLKFPCGINKKKFSENFNHLIKNFQ